MSSYAPIADNHAIQEAVIGVRLFEQVNEEVFEKAVSLAGELAAKHDLPGRLRLDPLSLMFGRQSISPGSSALEVTPGMLFQRTNSSGEMQEELTLERSAVTYRTRNYKRWADVVTLIDGILAPVTDVLCSGKPEEVSVAELRCLDVFTSSSEPPPMLSELISAECPYISSHLMGMNDLLHLHSGWFEDRRENRRTLVNLNIDLNDVEKGVRHASIFQMISVQAQEKGSLLSNSEISVSIAEVFAGLHKRDKNLLSQILNADLQDKINLVGSSGVGI